MILDMTEPVLGYDAEPVQEGGKVVTMQFLVWQALNGPATVDKTPEEKQTAFRISLEAHNHGGKLELSVEDATFVKKWSGIVNPPLSHGRLCEAIESASSPAPADD